MDNKKSFARFWHTALAFVLIIITVGASAGCISYGVQNDLKMHIFFGVLNLGWLYPVIRQAVIYIRKSNMEE